jgi:hypothetical protein
MGDRIQTVKTWRELEALARADGLRLFRTDGCVTVESTAAIPSHFLSITTEDLDIDDSDRLVRAALEGALDVLKSLHR